MIKNKKLTIIGAATLALACTAGATVISASAETPAVQDYASFAMLDGASVRVKKDEKAIRFTTRISREDLHTAVGGAENLANAKIVTLVTPTRYLDEAGLTDFDKDTDILMQPIEIKAENYVKNEANINETDTSITKSDYYYFNACLYNVEEANLSRKFSAKSYLLVGDTVVDYTAFDYEKNSRDIWYIADQAKQNSVLYPNTEATDEAYDYLDALSATFDVTVGDYTKTVKRGERLSWYADELKSELDKEDVANLTYSYYRGFNDYDDTQSVASDLTLTAKYDIINFADNGDGTYSVSTEHTLNEGAVLVIPKTFNGGNVTGVAKSAFANSIELTKIVLPESVTTVAAEAFWRNSNLAYISMTGVTALTAAATETTIASENAFFGCKSLTTVIVGKEFKLAGQVFKWRDNDGTMPGDHTVNLHTTATSEDEANLSIGNVSSGHNNLLTNKIVYYASENGKCAGWVYTDESKTAVETKTPHNNENGSCTVCGKTEVTNGLVYEWNGADGYTLTNGRNASGEVEILAEYGDGIHPVAPVTAIAAYAFSYQQVSAGTVNTALTGVIIPESVTTIGGSAFYRCTKLESLTLPASVTTMPSDMLGMCTALTYLDMRYITATATSGNNEMRSCSALETVIVNANLTVSSQMFSASASYPAPNPKILTAYVWTDGETMPDETCKFVTSYKKNANNVLVKEGGFCYYNKDKICAENTWYFADNGEIALVENTEHSWVSGACEHCGTAYVCTEHSYDENGKCSMCGAYNTQGVIYTWNGTGYTVTDGKAASGAVTILPYYNDGEHEEKAVTAIGASAFYQGSGIDNTALTSIDIPNTVTSIGNTAFARCTGLTKVVLPESVTSLGTESFWRCTNLAYMSMTGVKNSSTCGANIFLSCNSLKTLVVGSSLYIGIQIASTTNLSQVGQCTVYVSATQENAGSVYVFHNEGATLTGSPNNALLATDVVYMSTSETESGWYFDENGDIQTRTVE